MKKPKEHEYTEHVTCPYCDYEDEDSWEYGNTGGEISCGSCGKEFYMSIHIKIRYSTSVIK